jgi:hypothetical protein
MPDNQEAKQALKRLWKRKTTIFFANKKNFVSLHTIWKKGLHIGQWVR